VDLACDDNVAYVTLYPPSPIRAIFTITLTNTGEVPDTYDVCITENTMGWPCSFTGYSGEIIEASETKNCQLTVKVPPNAKDEDECKVVTLRTTLVCKLQIS
jgi:uncharacterized membrane protein